MDSWKAVVITILAMISTQTLAEDKGSYQNSMMIITMATTFLLSGTTGLFELVTKNFKPAKADALAFIGSDGEIRGAQFEQVVRFYRSVYRQPHMTDQQLALAIATSY